MARHTSQKKGSSSSSSKSKAVAGKNRSKGNSKARAAAIVGPSAQECIDNFLATSSQDARLTVNGITYRPGRSRGRAIALVDLEGEQLEEVQCAHSEAHKRRLQQRRRMKSLIRKSQAPAKKPRKVQAKKSKSAAGRSGSSGLSKEALLQLLAVALSK